MKVMRFLALAATLSMIFPLAAPASSNASKEQKKRVAVEDQVKLAGKTLMPGSYESTNKDGNKTISEIEWNNQREALRFGAPAHPAHHAHKGRLLVARHFA